MSISCVILCGGRSSRMGQDKALLEFGSMSLAEFVYNRLSKGFKQTLLCTKSPDERFSALNLPLLIESKQQPDYQDASLFSPLFGIKSALVYALKNKSKYVAIASVDSPFITPWHFQQLFGQIKSSPETQVGYITQILANNQRKEHFLISLWHTSTLDSLNKALKAQDLKVSKLIDSLSHLSLELDDNTLSFNLNTLQDYQNAQIALQSHEIIKNKKRFS